MLHSKCIICKSNPIKHKRLFLCTECYKIKRKDDWIRNESNRAAKNPNRVSKRKDYCRNMYYSKYREQRLVNKKCIDCDKYTLKGSLYNQCRECSEKRASKRKVKYQLNRKKNHLPTKIRENLSSRLRSFLFKSNVQKNKSIIDFLGCSISCFIMHIEEDFYPNLISGEEMSWDNYGKWHIDHIKPISLFDPNNKSELNKMSHYTNLQPLWAEDNFKKGSKYGR